MGNAGWSTPRGDPDKYPDWHDRCREEVGGDDFGEVLCLTEGMVSRIRNCLGKSYAGNVNLCYLCSGIQTGQNSLGADGSREMFEA